MLRLPRVAAEAVVWVDADGGQAKLMHVGLADEDGAGRLKRRHGGAVAGRGAPAQ